MAITLSRTPEDDSADTPCWGAKIAQDHGWSFDEIFRTQFRIGPTPVVASPHWKSRRLGEFWIENCPLLPATEIRSRRGQTIGWLMGVAIDRTGEPIGNKDSDYITVTANFETIERKQAQLAGRFAIIVKIEDETRYYPDASSSLTSVRNVGARVLASTVPLAINDRIEPPYGRTLREMQQKKTLFLMGETADARVTQNFGNHYIDLRDFTEHRFWPTEDMQFAPHEKPADVIADMTARLRSIMAGLGAGFDCTLPITGGRDSRLLASALTPEAARNYSNFYVHQINWATTYDVEAAQSVAKHLDLPFGVKRLGDDETKASLENLNIRATRAQIGLATGFACPNLPKIVLQAMHFAPASQLLLRGGAAEVAQANRWPRLALIPKVLTPEIAFERLCGQTLSVLIETHGAEHIERIWEKYKLWFANLPDAAKPMAIDMGHLELWLPSGMGAFFYAPRKHFYLNPYNAGTLLLQTLRFEPAYRKRGALVRDMLDVLSPGLSALPYSPELARRARVA